MVVLAGLTVYAAPPVLAATLPIGALSNQVGTVVKLVRVLMLGPVVLGLSLVSRHLAPEHGAVQAAPSDQALEARPARACAVVHPRLSARRRRSDPSA